MVEAGVEGEQLRLVRHIALAAAGPAHRPQDRQRNTALIGDARGRIVLDLGEMNFVSIDEPLECRGIPILRVGRAHV